MISESKARKFCCEDPSLIANYALAIADTTQTWCCHHILGEQYSKKYLKENGLYLNRPACELRFMTRAEHLSLHHKGVTIGPMSEEHKRAISDALKGVPLSEAHKKALSDAKKGIGGQKIIQYTKSGEFIKEWPSMREVERELGIARSQISAYCKGKRESAGGYIWAYSNI